MEPTPEWDLERYRKLLRFQVRQVQLHPCFQRRFDSSDLVQETLFAIHNQRHTYDAGQPLTAWVHAIARYKLVDLLRRRASRDALTEPLDDELAIFAASDTEASDARRDIGRLLDRLPERQRLPIVHTKLEGLSVTEAARLTGMSESAVKVGVHRGLKALAARIRNMAPAPRSASPSGGREGSALAPPGVRESQGE